MIYLTQLNLKSKPLYQNDKMFKVRFHLAKGKNFRKWQIKNKTQVLYYVPDEVQLVLTSCILRNNPKTAKQIYDGRNKTVCAWIECDDVQVIKPIPTLEDETKIIQYNPRITPNWTNAEQQNLDECRFCKLITKGRKVFKQ